MPSIEQDDVSGVHAVRITIEVSVCYPLTRFFVRHIQNYRFTYECLLCYFTYTITHRAEMLRSVDMSAGMRT